MNKDFDIELAECPSAKSLSTCNSRVDRELNSNSFLGKAMLIIALNLNYEQLLFQGCANLKN